MHTQHSLSNQPHDDYFKTTFSKGENVLKFLKHFLSLLAHQVLALIDLDILEFINPEVISSTKLSKLQGDVLLRFRLKNSDKYLYILFEHQSSGDKEMNLRLEEYKVQLRKKLMKIDKKISYFVTICVWAMKKPYQGATNIAEMYDSDEVHQILDNLHESVSALG